jgi:hypothetical protein
VRREKVPHLPLFCLNRMGHMDNPVRFGCLVVYLRTIEKIHEIY